MARRILIAVTGASGSILAERLIDFLQDKVERIYFVATDAGKQVIRHELKSPPPGDARLSLINLLEAKLTDPQKKVFRLLRNDDFFAPVASGSSAPTDMVVIPASMGTIARISCGLSTNLIDRCADVVIKEHRRLVVVPRESPLSTIHLENLLKLSKLGIRIIPPMPAFYNNPTSLDDVINFTVGKVLDSLEFENDIYKRWNSRMT